MDPKLDPNPGPEHLLIFKGKNVPTFFHVFSLVFIVILKLKELLRLEVLLISH